MMIIFAKELKVVEQKVDQVEQMKDQVEQMKDQVNQHLNFQSLQLMIIVIQLAKNKIKSLFWVHLSLCELCVGPFVAEQKRHALILAIEITCLQHVVEITVLRKTHRHQFL